MVWVCFLCARIHRKYFEIHSVLFAGIAKNILKYRNQFRNRKVTLQQQLRLVGQQEGAQNTQRLTNGKLELQEVLQIK